MSGDDAYEEMELRRRHDIDDPEFSSIAEGIRSAYRQPPEPSVEARHLRAIVEQTRRDPVHPIPHRTGERTRMRPSVGVFAKLALAAAGLGLLTGGLALAGVNLPVLPDEASDTSRQAITKAHDGGATPLPTPPDEMGDVAQSVTAAIEANLPLLHTGDISGCEFGAAVSAAARGIELDTSHCQDGSSENDLAAGDTAQRVQAVIETQLPLLHSGEISGCEFGAAVSAAARGAEADTSHCAGAEDQAGSSADSESSQGDDTSAESESSQGEDASAESENSQGDEASAEGKAKAEAAKGSGQAKGEEASGGKANAGGKPGKD